MIRQMQMSALTGEPVQEEGKEKARRANPIAYVTGDAPLSLIVRGGKDSLVPHNQSQILHETLRGTCIEARFYMARGDVPGSFKGRAVASLFPEFFNKHPEQQ